MKLVTYFSQVAARAVARLPKFLAASLAHASANAATPSSSSSNAASSSPAHLVVAVATSGSAHVEEWEVDVRPRHRNGGEDSQKDKDGGAITANIQVALDPVLESAEVAAAGFVFDGN